MATIKPSESMAPNRNRQTPSTSLLGRGRALRVLGTSLLSAISLVCACFRLDFPTACSSDPTVCATDDAGSETAEDAGADTEETGNRDSGTALDRDAAAESSVPDAGPSCAGDPCVISDATGIFVSSSLGRDDADGTQAAPIKTLAHALAVAGDKKYVFACAETFAETVLLPNGARLIGGLPCVGGAWGAPTELSTLNAPSSPAVRATSLSDGAVLANFRVNAPDAAAAGQSSIGVFVADSKSVRLVGVTVAAGHGGVGSNGGAGADATGTPADGYPGFPAISAVDYESTAGTTKMSGGPGGTTASKGGKGGSSFTGDTFAEDAEDGAFADATAGCGLGGKRSTAGASCIAGQKGCGGAPGTRGAGGGSVGTLTVSGYVASNAGADGGAGSPGGGGGGGSAGRRTPSSPTQVIGGSGGGGGGGGFPGQAGKAGGAGGASIGIASFNSNVSVTKSTVTTRTGGRGGDAGPGGAGGAGAAPGNGGSALSGYVNSEGCSGGRGGSGGNGGAGGGGGGGPSIGVAFVGTKPALSEVTINTEPGGGGGASAGYAGSSGARADTMAF